jgi:von Willebrand factor type A domain
VREADARGRGTEVEIQFLAPFAGAIAVLGVVPLLASLAVVLRATRIRSRLGLRSPTRWSRLPVLAALVLVAVLVGLAAAEPVVARGHVRHIRVGAEAFFVVDTSRSMLARPSEHAQTRLARAKQSVLALRSSLDDVRVGLASMTDRTLPHLLPSADPDVFASVLARSIGIEAPGPSGLYTTRATDFGALAVIPAHGYFSATARRRLVVVFTDGESRPFESLRLRSIFSTPPAIETIVVRFWSDDERVYTRGLPDAAYRPDSGSAKAVARLTAATNGTAYAERDLAAATARAREVVDGAQATAVDRDLTQTPLAPYLVAAVLVPLSFLLFRRSR